MFLRIDRILIHIWVSRMRKHFGIIGIILFLGYVENKEERLKKQREYTNKHRDHINKLAREYHERNKEKINKQTRDRYYKNHEKAIESGKKYREKVRLQVIEHYSKEKNCCELCGMADIDVLTIDHIFGGGRKHRKELKGQRIDNWLIKNNFPEGYRILCMNCQLKEKKRKNQYKLPNKIDFN